MNAIELVQAVSLAVVDPGTSQALNTVGKMLTKIERQRKHITILERSRMSQRRQIRLLRGVVANLLHEFAPRQAAGEPHLRSLKAQKYAGKEVQVGDIVATPGDSVSLMNAFEALGLKENTPVEFFDRRTQEIACG